MSDDTDAVLKLQDIGWVVRKAISMSAVTLVITLSDENGTTKIDIVQKTTASTNTEERWLDWQDREKDDSIFGKVSGKARWINISEVTDPHLKKDLHKESLDAANGEVIETWTTSVGLKGEQWTADQIWGFAIINGQRRYVRNIVVKRGDKTQNIRTVYDYQGPN